MEPLDNPLKGPNHVESFKRKILSETELDFNKFKRLENLAEGPKFLVIKRSDEGQDMSKVSAFLITKSVESVCGEVKSHSRLNDGTVLIQTKTLKQAKQLITLTRLNSEINVTIKEHERLNQSKGFISCREFKILSDKEILDELSSQNVIAIKRNKYRNDKKEEIESGSYVITFSTTSIPEFLYVAWERVRVREFIPAPLRCFICLKLGHHSSLCEKQEIERKCFNCGENLHTSIGEQCKKSPKCVNCDGDHQSTSKKCPRFEKEQTIQKIRVMEKVGFREAVYIYNQRQTSQQGPLLSEIIKNTKKPCGCQCNCNITKNIPATTTTKQIATTSTTTKITDIPQKSQRTTNNTNTLKNDKESDRDIDSEREMWNEIKKREIKKKHSENKKRKIVVSKNGTKQLTMTKTTTHNDLINNENETENMDCSDISENSGISNDSESQ